MAFDFSVDPEFQVKLDWMKKFVKEEIKPLDLVWPHDVFKKFTPQQEAIIAPLMQAVRDQDLWACHLGPELGGQGYGQVKLALMNEILGTTSWGPRIFGTQAPDTGNAEILAHFGTPEQKEQFLAPLLDGKIVSCFSMTEPQGGSDPGIFTTTAVKDGEFWVINGRKIWSSNARWASFFITMVVTEPGAPLTKRMSMFLLPADTPGINIAYNFGVEGEGPDDISEALIHYENVRVHESAILGGAGNAFAVAQTRLGGGRVHHGMRTIGRCQELLDQMAERVLSRTTKGELMSEKQAIQMKIADSYIELQQLRLLVMYTAWQIDQYQDYYKVRKDIAAIKVQMTRVYNNIAQRALNIHGAIGTSTALPFVQAVRGAAVMGLADGPTEVHQVTVSKQVLRDYKGSPTTFPTYLIPNLKADAEEKLFGKSTTPRVPDRTDLQAK